MVKSETGEVGIIVSPGLRGSTEDGELRFQGEVRLFGQTRSLCEVMSYAMRSWMGFRTARKVRGEMEEKVQHKWTSWEELCSLE